MLKGWAHKMAAIPYRVYLLFSALIPAVIYAAIAAVLVGLLSLRVTADNGLSIALFFCALSATACFRMVRDLWSIWPYAIHANKFKVDAEDQKSIEGKPTYNQYLHSPMLVSILSSAAIGLIIFLLSYWLVPYAFSMHLSVLWLIGVVVFPLVLFFVLIVNADIFYRSYAVNDGEKKSINISSFILGFYLFPEAVCFLVLNFAIINPLSSVQTASFDVAWVTILITISITTLLLLMSAHSNPMNYVIGSLNSKLIKIMNVDKLNKKLNKTDIKSRYKLTGFSVIAWWAFIVLLQITMATVIMKNYENWFYVFLSLAQVIWIASYLYLRNKMLKGAFRQVIQYHNSDDLKQGYIDLANKDEVPA